MVIEITEQEACVWCSSPCLRWAGCLIHSPPPKRVRSKTRERRWAARQCTECGLPAVNRRYCEEHRQQINERQRRERAAKREQKREQKRQERRERRVGTPGYCVMCVQPAVNKTHCEKHRLARNAYLVKLRAAKRSERRESNPPTGG